MHLLVEWANGKKDKLSFDPSKLEEIKNSLKTPWVNLNLHDETSGQYWYLFHAKKATICE